MTQADSAQALRMSLDSSPSVIGQGQAEITATTPLPDGWGSFCSRASRGDRDPGRWYASAPWDVDFILANVTESGRELALQLEQTVSGRTWEDLHRAVAFQVSIHAELSAGESL